MLASVPAIYGLPLSAALYGVTVGALDFRRHDGVDRVTKSPQSTQPAMLLQRIDDVCGVGMKLCPASLGGDCCPENYACATNSCYSTAVSSIKIPSTSSYTYSSPTGQQPYSSSVGYGCCPIGRDCGINQCSSTQSITVTTTTSITATASSTFTTITTAAVTARSSDSPALLDTLEGRANGDGTSQAANTSTTSAPASETDGSDSQDSLSTTQLGGIIGGAAAFLALVVAMACVLIRHIDRLAEQMARIPRSSNSRRTRTKQISMSDTESGDSNSQEGTINEPMRPSQTRRKTRSTARRNRQRRNSLYIATTGNSQSHRAQQRQDYSADIILQLLPRASENRRAVVPDPGHADIVSPAPIDAVSPRLLSSPSPLSAISTELEASSLAQELAGVSSAASLAADSLIHYAQDIPPSDLPRMAIRPPLAYQWMKSIGLLRQSENASPEHFSLDDDEEWHGFYGARGYMAGRTGLGITYPESLGGRFEHNGRIMGKRSR